MLKYVELQDFLTELKKQFKAYNWTDVTIGNDIAQDNLVGIVITGGGTMVLVDSSDAELNCGTVVADPITVLPFCPKKIKTGSTATVKAIYGV